jgi:REP element-mobilizing transposase RayT
MRALPILSDSYYHIYNRGSLKQILFYNQADYARFLFLIMYFQSPVILTQTNRYVRNYLETGAYGVKEKCVQDICEDRFVEVLNFCIMPNHFHLSVRSVTDDGISKYMHRVSSAYAAFFNKKYGRSGHVFQGAYKAKFISSDQQLTYLSAYIHHNPHELTEWKNKSHEYPWSSYQDCNVNRWGTLLSAEGIVQSFGSYQEYQDYVENSGAKEVWEDELL